MYTYIYIILYIYIPRHPIVLEKSTPPWFRTSFHENTWNMANRSNFVEIVIFVSFFETYYFLGAPSTNGQKNRTQLERNFAQVERNLKKYYTLQKYTSKIVYFFGRRPLFCETSSKMLKRQLFNSWYFFLVQMDVQYRYSYFVICISIFYLFV